MISLYQATRGGYKGNPNVLRFLQYLGMIRVQFIIVSVSQGYIFLFLRNHKDIKMKYNKLLKQEINDKYD